MTTQRWRLAANRDKRRTSGVTSLFGGPGRVPKTWPRIRAPSINEFRWGVADRGASIRIPLHVEKDGKGYFEDRRPAANMDPYEVCAIIMETVLG